MDRCILGEMMAEQPKAQGTISNYKSVLIQT
jgi:hypothetical protein